MNAQVAELQPVEVWSHFEHLNEIPRPSKKEERVIAFMKSFGEQLKLDTKVDDAGNIIIRKPATPGMEGRLGVVLQAHLDMVHQKNRDTDFDFANQGIRSFVDDGWVKAEGTTLGADNGIGAASIMAVLASDQIPHGPLEALFTIDEETGMTGAFALQPGQLEGSILLNTDTEDEGELCIGCAGGLDTNVRLAYEQRAVDGGAAYRLSVTGLRGGHSGCDIHLGRGNANKIMNRLLYEAQRQSSLSIHSIDGGSLRNAIPRESLAIVVVNEAQTASFESALQEVGGTIRDELRRAEPDLVVRFEPAELPSKVMESGDQLCLLQAIYAAPNGVLRMSDEMPGLVETSTSLARVHVEDGAALIQFLTRSSVESAKNATANQIEATFDLAGGETEHAGGYPGWNPNADSKILHLMKRIYEKLFGTAPEVNAVHAGLECGIIGSHYPAMDMISFGPTIKNPHSPDEQCEIASVEKYWRFLVETLKHIPAA